MFTFMNTARMGTALQGVAAAELAYQGALPYARERRSLRALGGIKEPTKSADAIIHHGDVRRMLLTCKAFAEGGRYMLYHTSLLSDEMLSPEHKNAATLDDDLGFLTPILKGFLTETGVECASLGMQVYGGHGFIRDNGMEQIYRDARIATMYAGRAC
jgi:alkylation response protein AidB-like acyl-CoA dehydrogenase